jgi:cytidylate kinase
VTRLIVAIDGPAASGKGTLARRMAAALDLPHLDTGLLYRAVARRADADGSAPEQAARALTPADLDDPVLRSAAVGARASVVAAIPAVRAALLDFQRGFPGPRGAVLDGRDIGTAIFPDAAVKLFVTATPEERARRRWRELADQGATYDAVLADIRTRDARDAGRDAAPMRIAEDAVVLDTTALSPDAAFDAAMRLLRTKAGGAT